MNDNRVRIAGAGPAGLVAAAVPTDAGIPGPVIEQARDLVVRRACHDEPRAAAADPLKHRAVLLRSSMIQSPRDLEAVA